MTVSDTDLCARCGGDCGMSNCPECGGCENTGPGRTCRRCPACDPEASDDADLGEGWEPCGHVHDEDCYLDARQCAGLQAGGEGGRT